MLWKKPRAGFRVRVRIFIAPKGGNFIPLALVLVDPLFLSCLICLILHPSLVQRQVGGHYAIYHRCSKERQGKAGQVCGELRK